MGKSLVSCFFLRHSVVKKLIMVHMEYRVGLRPNRVTVSCRRRQFMRTNVTRQFRSRERNVHYVVVSFLGTKLHGNETSRYPPD